MSRKQRAPLLILIAALALALSCSTLSNLADSLNTNPIANLDVDPDRTIFVVGGQPRTLDPATTLQGAGGPIGSIFSGLAALNPDLQVVPSLASGWDVSDDGATYTFYLRQDAQFHDGRPVTAADIKFSWERAAHPGTASETAATYLSDIVGFDDAASGQADSISGLRVIDPHTLEVQIDSPKPYFLSKLTYPVAFVVDSHQVGQNDWQRAPNGTGPFSLEEWQDDQHIILSRVNNVSDQPAAVNNVVYYMGAGIPLSMYENDEIDMVGIGGGTLERVLDPNDPLFPELLVGVDMCTSFVGFNTAEPPFDDPLVRQAFTMAVDRQKLINGLFRDQSLLAQGPLPPGMPGYDLASTGVQFDPDGAKDLLAQAGYEDPDSLPPITYTTSGYGSVNSLVTAIITMWQQNLGLSVEPVMLDPFTYYDELYAGRTGSVFSSGWCADYPDPENFLDILFHSQSAQNIGRYNNPQVDKLLEEARVEPDSDARLALYNQIEGMIVNDAPAIFIGHGLSSQLVKPHVQNYHLTPIAVPQWHLISLAK